MTINSMATIRKMTETPFEFVRRKIPPNLPLNFDCATPVKPGIQMWFLKKDMESCLRSNDKLFRGALRLAAELGNLSGNVRPQRAAPTAFKHLFFMDCNTPSSLSRSSNKLGPLQDFWDRPLSVTSHSHRLLD